MHLPDWPKILPLLHCLQLSWIDTDLRDPCLLLIITDLHIPALPLPHCNVPSASESRAWRCTLSASQATRKAAKFAGRSLYTHASSKGSASPSPGTVRGICISTAYRRCIVGCVAGSRLRNCKWKGSCVKSSKEWQNSALNDGPIMPRRAYHDSSRNRHNISASSVQGQRWGCIIIPQHTLRSPVSIMAHTRPNCCQPAILEAARGDKGSATNATTDL